jgi:hypothetical protein
VKLTRRLMVTTAGVTFSAIAAAPRVVAQEAVPCVATLSSAEPIVAGAPATLTFRIESIGSGLAAGDTVEIRYPLCSSFRPGRWTEPNISDPAAPGWIVVRGPAHAIVVPDRGEPLCRDVIVKLTKRHPAVLALVLDEPLYSGEVLEVVYGEPGPNGAGRARAQLVPVKELRFRAHLRRGPAASEIPWRGEPLEVLRTAAQRLYLSGPSQVRAGEAAAFRVAALDSLGFPAASFPEGVSLEAVHESGRPVGPLAPGVPGADPAVALTEPVELSEGVWWISVEGPGLDPGWDLPVVVATEWDRALVWGDLHWHTRDSDGSRSPLEGYLYARDIVGLDFASKTDHDMHYLFPCMDDEAWERSVRLVRELEEPGRFAVLLGWEWTSNTGHQNVYFDDAAGPYLPEPEYSTPQEVWAALPGRRALTVPHHPAGGNVPRMDWRSHDPEFQRPVEIFSTHGNAETPLGPLAPKAPREIARPDRTRKGSFQEALAWGREYTILTATDNHTGTPGNPVRLFRTDLDAGTGLGAAWVKRLDRENVFQAMANGATYGTTGPRIRIELSQTSSAPAGAGVVGRVVGCAALASCELIGIPEEGQPPFPVVATFDPHDRLTEVRWSRPTTQDPPIRGVYVRVIQIDGEMGWSSPVFFGD